MYGDYSWLSDTWSWSEYSGRLMAWSVINSGGGLWIHFISLHFTSLQSLSCVRLLEILWTVVHQASLSVHHQLPELAQTHIHWVGDAIHHLILCHPLLLLSIFPSIRVFSNESALCIRWPKYWSFSFSISPSNENSGLISFKIDWFNLLTVQGMLKSLLQHHSSKASILWLSVLACWSKTICLDSVLHLVSSHTTFLFRLVFTKH